jgi:hypothetical protein
VCEPTSHSGSQAFALPQLDAAAMRRQLRKCPSAPLFRDNLTPWHDNLVFRRRQLLGFNFQFCLSIFLSLGEKKPVSAKEKRRLTSQPRERGSSSTEAPYSSNWNRRRHGLALLFSDTAMLANAIATAIDPNVIAHAALSKKKIESLKIIKMLQLVSKSAHHCGKISCAPARCYWHKVSRCS